jgi:hypothetical protein
MLQRVAQIRNGRHGFRAQYREILRNLRGIPSPTNPFEDAHRSLERGQESFHMVRGPKQRAEMGESSACLDELGKLATSRVVLSDDLVDQLLPRKLVDGVAVQLFDGGESV